MAFAIIVDSVPVEVFSGTPFTSTQFKITTDEEAAWSFAAIGTVIDKDVGHGATALDAWDDDDRARYCVHTFAIPVPPDGQRLTSYALTLDGDSIVATGEFDSPEVPGEVLRVQGRLQLLAEGLLGTVGTAVAAQDDATIKEYWASTPVFRRNNAMLTGMWAALGRTPEQLDATFIAAANIPT